ncbi:splicing factor 3A subunit 1 [Platysternon megacephalum]|uniref:Splicing factor 3A subunit 1 n=1 Tax=Platysternon megacephalum TaxID=55544 RepID=A0A4D9E6F9_9SAUR|nr:splicing factor 3A subunit 1 [Platysternon megacephalum]
MRRREASKPLYQENQATPTVYIPLLYCWVTGSSIVSWLDLRVAEAIKAKDLITLQNPIRPMSRCQVTTLASLLTTGNDKSGAAFFHALPLVLSCLQRAWTMLPFCVSSILHSLLINMNEDTRQQSQDLDINA